MDGNTHTEDEARKKTCQESIGTDLPQPYKCMASDCMAWLWASTRADNQGRGFCGLARR